MRFHGVRAYFLLALIGWGVATSFGGEAGRAMLVIVVEGSKNTDGAIVVSVFGSEETFLKEAIFWRKAEPDPSGRTVITFDRAEFPPEFAISLYHDVNDNGKLDTGFMRIPKEPYGFSNNPGFRMGPPKFKPSILVRDEVEGDIVIRLK